jgi:hypothetical protein
MQIFEITQPQQVNEILGAAKAVAGGLGRAALQKFTASQGIDAGLGAQQASGLDRQGTAMQVNAGLVKSLASKSEKVWMQVIQNMLAQSRTPVASIAEIDSNELQVQLQMLVNQLAGFDTTKMDKGSPVAAEIAARLPQAMDRVVKTTQAPRRNPSEMTRAWQELATYIAQAQNINTFAKTRSQGSAGEAATVTVAPDGTLLYDGQRYNASNPRHALAMNALKAQKK